ncbi:hypothetical protein [Streptomyces sp. t39]|uniref:hypothetical protein n=1 Tax=Streptomyces sp. t39 TaxID=1828156 RepID=UPI0021C92D3E|nr:hypothetical protein [Streptomyces sp. t39]
MKLRRILATAVVTAVTTPAVLFAAGTALAETGPGDLRTTVRESATAADTDDDSPTIDKLRKAAEEAQKAYDAALARKSAAAALLDALSEDDHPLVVAAATARTEAEAAKEAVTAAGTALADAEKALRELPGTATEEERAAAQAKVTEAAKTLADAGTASNTAQEKAKAASKAVDDARVAASTELHLATVAVKDAREAKEAADEALADALADQECVVDNDLTSVAKGLPAKITAGTTVDFTVTVTNGTAGTLDDVNPFVFFHATTGDDYDIVDEHFTLEWAPEGSTEWEDVTEGTYAGSVGPLKPGATEDVKLRLTVDAKAPAADGIAYVAADYDNEDGSCGGNDMTEYDFDLLAAAGPAPTPSPTGGTTPQTNTVTPQGTTNGTLAATGSSATLQLSAAAATAVALGAGAVLVARRRRTV